MQPPTGRGGDSTRAACDDLARLSGGEFATVLADPPWRFMNRTGKVAPEPRLDFVGPGSRRRRVAPGPPAPRIPRWCHLQARCGPLNSRAL